MVIDQEFSFSWRTGYRLLLMMFIVILCLSCSRHQENTRSPMVYEVPADYRGHLCLEFLQPSCTPLPYENGKWVLRFPESGYLCTRTEIEYGRGKDEYYFVSETNERIAIPGDQIQGGGTSSFGIEEYAPTANVTSFLVGSNEDRFSKDIPGCQEMIKAARGK